MSAVHDVIVVGAGHNGLTTAALLARRGRKVLVLERRDFVGGLAASEEFHAGYRSAGLLHDTSGVRPSVVAALGLVRRGLRMRPRRPDVLALGRGGPGLLLHGDSEAASRSIGVHSPRDAERFLHYRGVHDRFRPVLETFFDRPAVDLVNLKSNSAWDLLRRAVDLRRLGRRDMMELLRLAPMCAADWLGEWFASDLLKAALALPALSGTFLAPRSPGSNLNLLLREAAAGPGVLGDGPALVAALERTAGELGVEIRTGSEVERVLLDSGSVCGVALGSGEEIRAPVVAASCDPKQLFLRLISAGGITHRLEQRIRKFRTRGTTAQILLALDGPLEFASRPGEPVEFARVATELDEIERAFDAVKYRTLPERPVLEVHVPTVSAPELAPPGHAVVSILAHFVPHTLESGWSDADRDRLLAGVQGVLEEHAPGLGSRVVAHRVLAPENLESRYGTTGGHAHHGEHATDQLLVRPAPECVGHRTPVPGLYLCGSGSHPGGGLTCAPGALAASAILAG